LRGTFAAPEVRKSGLSTIIMADGFSCKEQIAQQTNRHALHLAQVLQIGLRPELKSRMYPEQKIVTARETAQKNSMIRAALVFTAALTAAAAGFIVAKRLRNK